MGIIIGALACPQDIWYNYNIWLVTSDLVFVVVLRKAVNVAVLLFALHLAREKHLQPPWIVDVPVPAEQCTNGSSHPPHLPLQPLPLLQPPVVPMSTPDPVEPTSETKISGQLPLEEQGILYSRKKYSLVPLHFPPSNQKLEVGRPWMRLGRISVNLHPNFKFPVVILIMSNIFCVLFGSS